MSRMPRREFLRLAASGTAGLALGAASSSSPALAQAEARSRVVIVRHEQIMDAAGKVNPLEVRKAVAKGVMTFADTATEAEAWAKYYGPPDRIGIKVNCLGAPGIATQPAVASAIAAGLLTTGVFPFNILIWDRRNDELLQAGYQVNIAPQGIQCYGTDTPRVGYEKDLTISRSAASCLSRILTFTCTAQVNAPVLKDHGIVGMTGALKNFLGGVDNPNKYHDSRGNPLIADIAMLPQIKDAQRLIVMDAINVQYEGGPSFDPAYVKPCNCILVGADPVAVDTIATLVLEEIRAKQGLPSLAAAGRPPEYLETAADAEHKLGHRDLGEIELMETKV